MKKPTLREALRRTLRPYVAPLQEWQRRSAGIDLQYGKASPRVMGLEDILGPLERALSRQWRTLIGPESEDAEELLKAMATLDRLLNLGLKVGALPHAVEVWTRDVTGPQFEEIPVPETYRGAGMIGPRRFRVRPGIKLNPDGSLT